MRPARLEVEGFTAFTETTVVEFGDADLFALSGPTGSGKSSLIDAIVFALYGTIPRYDDRRLVHPVISQGRAEARVRLDFTVGGDAYVAVRVVRRQGEGRATTKEARLERRRADEPSEVLAGNADEMNDAVVGLLGLTFEHFTTCVVLPQGDFARFLHDKPAQRQDLLVRLLDLGVYARMGQLARARADVARGRLAVIDERVDELAGATPDARGALERRIALLEKTVARIDEAQPEVVRLTEEATRARATVQEAGTQLTLVRALVVPDDVTDLGGKLALATAELHELTTAETAAIGALEAAEAAAGDLDDRRELEEAQRNHRDLAAEEAEVTKGETALAEATEAAEVTASARVAADAALAEATEAVEEAHRQHQAHALVATLEVGAPCPVCGQDVAELPDHEDREVDQLEAARVAAADHAAVAGEAHEQAERERQRVVDKLDAVRERLAAVSARLEGRPSADDVERALARIERVEADLRTARSEEKRAREERAKGEQRRAALRAKEDDLRRRYDEARDAVAVLGPPPAGRSDLAVDWRQLADWADRHRAELEDRVTEAEKRAAEADAARIEIVARIEAFCRHEGLVLDGQPPKQIVQRELYTLQANLEQLDGDLARRAELVEERQTVSAEAEVASTLATHLKADRFERWILDEAMARLVEGATATLLELTDNAYSLTVDEKRGFAVVDHANADTVRPARTLSGGETFLASLALALSLADQIADLAAGGAVRLESILLDEGFGSLDLDTLDTVAVALEELGARGRMVGVVTHVGELAERLPVRFEVRKGPATSTVARVEV